MANYGLKTETTTHVKGMTFSGGDSENADILNSLTLRGTKNSRFFSIDKFIDNDGNPNIILSGGVGELDDILALIPTNPYVINKERMMYFQNSNDSAEILPDSATGKYILWVGDGPTPENIVHLADEGFGASKLYLTFF